MCVKARINNKNLTTVQRVLKTFTQFQQVHAFIYSLSLWVQERPASGTYRKWQSESVSGWVNSTPTSKPLCKHKVSFMWIVWSSDHGKGLRTPARLLICSIVPLLNVTYFANYSNAPQLLCNQTLHDPLEGLLHLDDIIFVEHQTLFSRRAIKGNISFKALDHFWRQWCSPRPLTSLPSSRGANRSAAGWKQQRASPGCSWWLRQRRPHFHSPHGRRAEPAERWTAPRSRTRTSVPSPCLLSVKTQMSELWPKLSLIGRFPINTP